MLKLIERFRAIQGAPPTADQKLVARATTILGIGDFRLFEIAHKEWFGRPAPVKELEHIFMAALYDRSAPPWVRHFARQVLRLAEAGRLDPTAFGLPARPVETLSLAQLEYWSAAISMAALGIAMFLVPAL